MDWNAQRTSLYLQRWRLINLYQYVNDIWLGHLSMRNAEAIGNIWCLVFVGIRICLDVFPRTDPRQLAPQNHREACRTSPSPYAA